MPHVAPSHGASGGTIDVPGTAIQIYTSGSITGPGNTLTKSGTGTLRVTTPTSITFSKLVVTGGLYQAAADTIFGPVPVAPVADAITLNGGGISSNGGFSFHANRGITLGSSGGTINTSSSAPVLGVITGAGALTKTGANILTLSGDNDYSGGTNLDVGRINFNHNNAAGTGLISVANAAGIEFTSTALGIVLANNIALAGGVNTAKFYATTGNSLRLNGQISGLGGILRDDTGAGTLTLAGNSNFSGGVKVVSRGLVIGHANALGTGTLTLGDILTPPASAITLSASTPLTGANAVSNPVQALRDFTVTGVDALELSGDVGLGSSIRTITTSNSGGTILSGVINHGGLTKAGAGSLTLTGDNMYGGGTIINNGTLYANNSSGSATGSGSVTVNMGGTLAGSGAVLGAVVVQANGTLAPGTSIESLATGALTFNGNSNLDVEINSNTLLSVAADLLDASGGLTIALDNTANLNLVDLAGVNEQVLPADTKFTLVRYAEGQWNGGTFAGMPNLSTILLGVNTFVITYDDATGGINFGGGTSGGSYLTLLANPTVIPEASAMLFGALACGIAAGGRRWRRRG
ncbi:MAG TPA: autotransporter-associated beta strand repeat-containing protein [Lacipirellulaceae bacterium]|nr:autotransporter-associated beta strand repeat-containing protein [Lacipirellulaceae bacterium]